MTGRYSFAVRAVDHARIAGLQAADAVASGVRRLFASSVPAGMNCGVRVTDSCSALELKAVVFLVRPDPKPRDHVSLAQA